MGGTSATPRTAETTDERALGFPCSHHRAPSSVAAPSTEHRALSTLRLGIVPYLNVLPLLEGLDAHIPRSQWVRATPRELAGLLAAGEIDVASLPIFEVLRAGSYDLVPGCAIACDGPVRSVQLFSKVPIASIRTMLVDRASLSSANLVRVILADAFGLRPPESIGDAPFTRSFDWKSSPHDAFLVIGDTALQWEREFPHALDLGAAWKGLTGLPFVFAAWAVRPGAPVGQREHGWFLAARERGENSARRIAREAASAEGIEAESLADYLSQSIRYRLGERELLAIEEYRRRLLAHGLLSVTPAANSSPPEVSTK